MPACSIGQFAQKLQGATETVTVRELEQRQALLDFLQYGPADVFQQIYKSNAQSAVRQRQAPQLQAVIVRAFSIRRRHS